MTISTRRTAFRSRTRASESVERETPTTGICIGSDDPLTGKVVVRPAEAWKILCCGHNVGYKLINSGHLTVTKVRGMTLIHVDSIRRLLNLTT